LLPLDVTSGGSRDFQHCRVEVQPDHGSSRPDPVGCRPSRDACSAAHVKYSLTLRNPRDIDHQWWPLREQRRDEEPFVRLSLLAGDLERLGHGTLLSDTPHVFRVCSLQTGPSIGQLTHFRPEADAVDVAISGG